MHSVSFCQAAVAQAMVGNILPLSCAGPELRALLTQLVTDPSRDLRPSLGLPPYGGGAHT